MKRVPPRPPLKSGLDTVGPFHPYLVYAAVLLLDLAGLALGIFLLIWVGDLAEDLIWPGGTEWVDF
ncbi:MAG: hypothetical protein ACT4N8_16280 [Sphingosinicella sp.]|uniref:hypothetical protein n=1 Tax=Sphingosinicella sp. TaxID=1917971 RepID=UPI004037A6BA